MPTFKQIRSAVNVILNAEKKHPYQKHQPEDVRILAMHICGQFGFIQLKKGLVTVKLKHIKSCLSKIVDGATIDDTIDSLKSLIVDVKIRENRRLIHGRMTSITNHDEHFLTVCNLPASKFYQTPEWRSIRYQVFREQGRKCSLCGATTTHGKALHVDHIKPRSYYPELALTKENLQVLCEDCNIGKSNRFSDDWRL